MTAQAGSSSQYCRKSLPDRSALLPIEMNDDSPRPGRMAWSISRSPGRRSARGSRHRRGPGQPAEGRVEPDLGVRVDDAHAVGAHQPHAGAAADGEELALARRALGAGLGETRRRRRSPSARPCSAHSRATAHGVGSGHDDDGEIDGLRDVGDGAVGGNALHDVGARVDRVDGPREPAREQVVEQLAADGATPPRRPDHRHRARVEQRAHRRRGGELLAALEARSRAAPVSAVGNSTMISPMSACTRSGKPWPGRPRASACSRGGSPHGTS